MPALNEAESHAEAMSVLAGATSSMWFWLLTS